MSEARACASWACALRTCAFAVSLPRRPPPPRRRSPGSAASRASWCALVALVCARRPTSPAPAGGPACALVRFARAESTCVWNSDGSSLGNHLSLADDRVEVGAEGLDGSGHLAAHLNRRHCLERSCRRDRVDDRPARDRCRDDRGRRLASPRVERADGQSLVTARIPMMIAIRCLTSCPLENCRRDPWSVDLQSGRGSESRAIPQEPSAGSLDSRASVPSAPALIDIRRCSGDAAMARL